MSWFEYEIQNFKNGASSFNKLGDCFRYESLNRNKPYRYINTGILAGTNDRYAYYPLKKGKKYKEFISLIKEALGDEVRPFSIIGDEPDYSNVYSKDFYLRVSQSDGKINFSCYSFEDEMIAKVIAICKKYLNLKEKKNSNVYMLASSRDGLMTKYMGSFKNKLNRNNYSSGVLGAFDSCIKEIKKKVPRGRLSVFYGPPGTGKTYLLRSVINAIPNGIFFSVQPEVFKKHNATDILETLSGFKGSKLILLIEDADSILCDRKSNSEDIVSNVLNLTDGFMGECLDINLVCTTNIEKLAIDRAYRRRGRMNSFIEIGQLSAKEAQVAYDAISNKDKPEFTFKEGAILADIYAKADPDFEDDDFSKPVRRIGFGVSSPSEDRIAAVKLSM